MKPLTVSVIVCIYKVEKYLRKCLDSIVNQTYLNLEIILIDDGSPDNCPQIIDDYAAQDSRIRVIHKKNGGVSDAKNTGLSAATGDLIIFVDSDDYISPDMYTKMVRSLEDSQSDMVICGYSIVSHEGNLTDYIHNNPLRRLCRDEFMAMLLLGEIGGFSWNKLCRSEIYHNVHFPVGQSFQDLHQSSRLFSTCETIFILNECLYFYRTNPQSVTQSGYPRGSFDLFLAYKQQMEFAKIEYPEHIDRYLIFTYRKGLATYNRFNWKLVDLDQTEAEELIQYLLQNKKLAQKSSQLPLKIKIALWFFGPNRLIYDSYYRLSRAYFLWRMNLKTN